MPIRAEAEAQPTAQGGRRHGNGSNQPIAPDTNPCSPRPTGAPRCQMEPHRWWRGHHSAPWAAMVAWASSPRMADRLRGDGRTAGRMPAAPWEATVVLPAAPWAAMVAWASSPRRGGHLRGHGRTVGRMPTAPWEATVVLPAASWSAMVAWASSPRMADRLRGEGTSTGPGALLPREIPRDARGGASHR
jgi:hypothetical protein